MGASVVVRARGYVGVCVRERVGMCVRVTLFTQHAKRMGRIIFSPVASQMSPCFSTLSHKWQDYRKTVIEHKMGVWFFIQILIQNISHSRKNSARFCHIGENSSFTVPVNIVGL